MRNFILIAFFFLNSLSTFSFSGSSKILKSIDLVKNSKDKKTFLKRVSNLQQEAKTLKKESKNDKEFYFYYDLEKSIDVITRLKKFNTEECYRTKIELFSLYGVRNDNFNKSDLPVGAALSYDFLSHFCK